jgi:Domain of unknown function (DUF397)
VVRNRNVTMQGSVTRIPSEILVDWPLHFDRAGGEAMGAAQGWKELAMANVDLSQLAWRKSLASDETNCVEVAAACGLVMVRDSKSAESATLAFPSSGWAAFLGRVRNNIANAALPSSGTAHEHGLPDASRYLAGSWAYPAAPPRVVRDRVGTWKAKVGCER